MVAADEDDLFGHGVGAFDDAHVFGGALDHGFERSVFGAEGDDVCKGIQHKDLVDVDVGDDGMLGDGGIVGEIFGAEFAGFFAGDGDEEDRAARARIHARESLGDFENCCGAGSVVERAVVDGVAFVGFADAEMIEMRGVDEIFAFEDGIAAFEFGDDVGTVEVFGFGDDVNFRGDGQREDGELSIFGAGENFVGGVAGAFEEFARRVDAEKYGRFDLREVVVGMAFFVEPAEFGIDEIADEFCEGIHSFGNGIVDGDDADGAVVGGDFGFDFKRRVVGFDGGREIGRA